MAATRGKAKVRVPLPPRPESLDTQQVLQEPGRHWPGRLPEALSPLLGRNFPENPAKFPYAFRATLGKFPWLWGPCLPLAPNNRLLGWREGTQDAQHKSHT